MGLVSIRFSSPSDSYREPSLHAEATGKVYAGGSAEEMAEQYQCEYWRVDNEVLKVMAQQLSLGHKQLINDLLNVIYTPWLEAVTNNFQAVVKKRGIRELDRPVIAPLLRINQVVRWSFLSMVFVMTWRIV